MKPSTSFAIILALGLILSAVLIGGRYEIVRASEYGAYRLDRWTGDFSICSQWDDGEGNEVACVNAPELRRESPRG
jgi:hypothetical protein